MKMIAQSYRREKRSGRNPSTGMLVNNTPSIIQQTIKSNESE